jgi:hypothetical protein
VIGEVGDSKVVLESAMDMFSKRLVGRLEPAREGTSLEGFWVSPFWSRVWANEKCDEEEIIRFLAEYGRFKKEA